ncbi:hypothetical protein ACBP89_22235 [Aneurinibacillus aneurinilyticus]|uniref:hypothetical protein n=3 Tax=Aneurinibacillus aneurinilyticus TaxID=1391 RepID=UPI0035243FDA
MRKIKRVLASAGVTFMLLTGCSSGGAIDFAQYANKQMEIKSMESQGTTAINLKYDSSKIKDKEELKFLQLFNDVKISAHIISENKDMMSADGKIILRKGDIPFKLFINQKEMIIQLDNASKPIRLANQDDSSSANQENYLTMMKELTPYIIKNLPNPSRFEITSKQDKVQGENIDGKNVHVQINGDEIPSLILNLMDGISKDKEAIEAIVRTVNNVDATAKMTTETFKNELNTMVRTLKEQVSTIQQDKTLQQVFNKNNYVKADILIDNQLYERKSDVTLHFAFPTSNDSGIQSLHIQSTTEKWNMNQPVKAQPISATHYLDEKQLSDDTTGKLFLETLDKQHSVLYDILVNDMKVYTDKTK